MTERILFYTPQYDPTGWQTVKLDVNNFQPLRDYFQAYQGAIGLSLKQINEKLGHRKAEHAFYWNSTQWDLPTAETYAQLGEVFPCDFKRREYEDLRREYEDLRREYEDLRRVWNTDGETLDVIVGPIVSQRDNTDHPTTKPIWLMKKLIKVSTNPGDTVLDFTCGSGSTGVASVDLGRPFIGIDNGTCEKEGSEWYGRPWVELAHHRIANVAGEFMTTKAEKERGTISMWDYLQLGGG